MELASNLAVRVDSPNEACKLGVRFVQRRYAISIRPVQPAIGMRQLVMNGCNLKWLRQLEL